MRVLMTATATASVWLTASATAATTITAAITEAAITATAIIAGILGAVMTGTAVLTTAMTAAPTRRTWRVISLGVSLARSVLVILACGAAFGVEDPLAFVRACNYVLGNRINHGDALVHFSLGQTNQTN